MMAILTKFFGKMIFQERKSLHKKPEKDIDDDIKFEIKKNENYFCFMKYCFNNKRYYNSALMIKHALKEQNYCNIIIKFKFLNIISRNKLFSSSSSSLPFFTKELLDSHIWISRWLTSLLYNIIY